MCGGSAEVGGEAVTVEELEAGRRLDMCEELGAAKHGLYCLAMQTLHRNSMQLGLRYMDAEAQRRIAGAVLQEWTKMINSIRSVDDFYTALDSIRSRDTDDDEKRGMYRYVVREGIASKLRICLSRALGPDIGEKLAANVFT